MGRENTDYEVTDDGSKLRQDVDRPHEHSHDDHIKRPELFQPMELEIVWGNVFRMAVLHVLAFAGLFWTVSGRAKILTFLFAMFLHVVSGMGVTAGAHRLWAHRTYKASVPFRLLLTFLFTMAFQNSIFTWARDHRLHHKYSDTDADPHNARRGFFFSHVGWLLVRKHPLVKEKGRNLDMTDLRTDPIVMFQHRNHMLLGAIICFLLPAALPWILWNESFLAALLVCSCLRYVTVLHTTWLINSAAHMWGMKPYDKGISPTENKTLGIWAGGEGWHNYHHTFPWDYRTAELGGDQTNFTAEFIDFFASLGWAYDLKTVAPSMIESRVIRTGDGTWEGKPV